MKRKLIGQVGVDSGQLMVIDPCYIDSQWNNSETPIGIKFWGQGQNETAEILKASGHEVVNESGTYRIYSDNPNYLENMQGVIRSCARETNKIVLSSLITESTYDNICDITCSEDQAGQLSYRLGHEGLGVVFSSGLGDGLYDVYATYKTLEGWGERITKVEIELITDEELE